MVILFFWACNSTSSIKELPNSLPTVQIQSHSSGAQLQEGYPISFYALTSDSNHSINELQVAWYLDDVIVCDWSTPQPNGESLCVVTPSPDSSMVSVQVVDIEQGGGRDEIEIDVVPTQAPTASIVSPQMELNYYSNQLILFSAVVDDAEDTPSDLLISWESSIDGMLSLNTNPDSSGEIEDYMLLSEGQHAIKLYVEDSSGKNVTESVVIQVGGENSIPACSILQPESGSAVVLGEEVSFQALATDEDIGNFELSVQWESDKDGVFGSSTPSSDGDVLFSTDALSSGTHTITLIVKDEVDATCTDNMLLSVGTPPEVEILSPSSGDIVEAGASLVFQAQVQDETDVASDIELEWSSDIDGVISNQASDSSGLVQFSNNTLSAGTHFIILQATDSDGLSGSASVMVTVNSAPVVDAVTISPSAPTFSDSVTCTASATDPDGDSFSTSYQWVDQNSGAVLGNTSVLNLSTLNASGSLNLECLVTAEDTHGAVGTGSASINVSNSAPLVQGLTITPSQPRPDDILTCGASITDPEGDSLQIDYSWTNVSTGVVLGSSSTLDVTPFGFSSTTDIQCTIVATDTYGSSASATGMVSVVNHAPVMSNVIVSSNDYNDALLECISNHSDPDNDVVSTTFEWSNLTTGQVLATSSVLQLDSSLAMPADQLQCTTEATDTYGASVTAQTSTTILNRAPQAPNVTITPAGPIEQIDDLTCSATSVDLDDDALTYSYSWLANGTPWSTTALPNQISASNTTSGDVWTCSVTASDGSLSSAASSATVTISPEFETHSFTPCGSTGRYGPTQSDCNTEYQNTVVEVVVTDGIQYWEVPITGTYELEAWGAQGGNGGKNGGLGARMRGTFSFTAGDTLKVLIGQRGVNSGNNDATGHSGGGGGGTFVATDTDTPLLIAGGGGGGGVVDTCTGNYEYLAGGADGTTGEDGTFGRNNACANVGTNGQGGQGDLCSNGSTPGAGFYSDSHDYSSSYGLRAYGFVNGGNGATQNFSSSSTHGGFGGGGAGAYGGGGGGGYSGGGTGDYNNPCRDTGGGGGGSYNSGTDQDNSAAARQGHGLLTISFLY